MAVTSNLETLIAPGLVGVSGTVSARLSACQAYVDVVAVPEDMDERLAELVASARPVAARCEAVALGNPCARYADVEVELADGTCVHARLIEPTGSCRMSERVPLVLMFHDAGRPVRGWHHMTRFTALGYAVLALDAGVIPADDAAKAYPEFVRRALAVAQAYLGTSGVDAERICTWGEGLGGALAIAVAAALPERIAKCAACAAYPADRGVPAYLDPVALASRLQAELLLGSGLRDEVANTETQMTIANNAAGPARLVVYPEHAHERINEFENEVLRFIRFD